MEESHDDALVKDVKRDHHEAQLSPENKVMLEFAEKLTLTPSAIVQEDVQSLRDAGFSDEQIVDIVMITCQFNFMDRLADGLGVELVESVRQAHLTNVGAAYPSLITFREQGRLPSQCGRRD